MTLQENIQNLSSYFSDCQKPEQLYKKIIELGLKLPTMRGENKIDQNLVIGCQSKTYLFLCLVNNRITIEADSDALISKGICAIFFLVYNKVTPIEILKHEPSFVKNLNIQQSLSPNRSNGLIQILNKIKKDTLKLYMQATYQ